MSPILCIFTFDVSIKGIILLGAGALILLPTAESNTVLRILPLDMKIEKLTNLNIIVTHYYCC